MKNLYKPEFKVPEWAFPYFPIHGGYGVKDVEEYMVRKAADININAPLALIQISISAQLSLLYRLNERGLLTSGEVQP